MYALGIVEYPDNIFQSLRRGIIMHQKLVFGTGERVQTGVNFHKRFGVR